MARTVNQEEYAAKRNEIVAAAQQVIFTKGYAQMTIQDILDAVNISSGAFYHYFDSKPALLDALIEQIKQTTEEPLLPIIRDPRLPAIDKLRGFFSTLDRLRAAHRLDVIKLGRVWYGDANALIRQKVDEAVRRQRAPLLNEIVRQGIQEGVFTTAYPDQAGEIILCLLQGMGNAHAQLLLSVTQEGDAQSSIEGVVAVHAAYMDAIERVLGARPNSLYRVDAEAAKVWLDASRDST